MKAFIAFSGETSRKLAAQIREWLPPLLPGFQFFFAPWDIAKGTTWRDIVRKKLKSSGVAILCLTKEGLHRPWILWEAGGSARVYPILFGMQADELAHGPLEQFQSTEFRRDDMLRLVQTLNALSSAPRVTARKLLHAFEGSWDDLEKNVTGVLKQGAKDVVGQITGSWWERITSHERAAISFVQIRPIPGKDTLRLLGSAYGVDGKQRAQWESQVVLVDPAKAQLAYLWEGEFLAAPEERRRGIGVINFFQSKKGTIEAGQGSFEDTNMKDFYASKKFKLLRATPREEIIMTGYNERRKTVLVKKKLCELS